MTIQQTTKLTKQAMGLFTLGLEVERRRDRLRQLVAKGVAYGSKEMREALQRFQETEREWNELEQQHLAFRGLLTQTRYNV